MKKTLLFFTILVIIFAMYSCKKDDKNLITGLENTKWKFSSSDIINIEIITFTDNKNVDVNGILDTVPYQTRGKYKFSDPDIELTFETVDLTGVVLGGYDDCI